VAATLFAVVVRHTPAEHASETALGALHHSQTLALAIKCLPQGAVQPQRSAAAGDRRSGCRGTVSRAWTPPRPCGVSSPVKGGFCVTVSYRFCDTVVPETHR
jgi:hypothetical protein